MSLLFFEEEETLFYFFNVFPFSSLYDYHLIVLYPSEIFLYHRFFQIQIMKIWLSRSDL